MGGKPCVANDVLPHADVDFVSYSAYDSLGGDGDRGAIARQLPEALDYLESKLRPKPGIAGRRTFVGEYGFPADRFGPAEQDARSRLVMSAALDWGCRFALYWQVYNNEVNPDGTHRGYWLVDDKGVRQPVYETHREYYEWARAYVTDHVRREGRPPPEDAFRAAAVAHLRDTAAAATRR